MFRQQQWMISKMNKTFLTKLMALTQVRDKFKWSKNLWSCLMHKMWQWGMEQMLNLVARVSKLLCAFGRKTVTRWSVSCLTIYLTINKLANKRNYKRWGWNKLKLKRFQIVSPLWFSFVIKESWFQHHHKTTMIRTAFLMQGLKMHLSWQMISSVTIYENLRQIQAPTNLRV